MGASRIGYDLFTQRGRKNFFNGLKNWKTHDLGYIWRDTFAKILCLFIGHNKYDSNAGGYPEEWACKRCCKYVKK